MRGAGVPHHFEFNHEHKILLTVLEGEIEGPEIYIIDKAMREQIKRTQPAAGISDLSRVTRFNVPSHVMHEAAQGPPPFPESVPRFIVAASDLVYGMNRMYQTLADRPRGRLKVVRRIEEAFADLGIEKVEFERIE